MITPALRTETTARPRFEGSNICTWIGFKHVMYLMEEAVLDHLRSGGLVPRQLYEDHGIAVEIVDSDVRIPAAVHMDDHVRTKVRTEPADDSGELVFRAESFVDGQAGGQAPVKVATATLRVVLRQSIPPATPPPELARYMVARIARDCPGGPGGPGLDGQVRMAPGGRGAVAPAAGPSSFIWRWRIPYFYCHYSQRLQHSGYLRLMEEVVDLFLADRGISIKAMLDRRSWIPVVPRAQVSILGEAWMEEDVYTVFTVEDVYKNLTYTARMDCYVSRDGEFTRTATGRITHGYAVITSRRDWSLVPFDEPTLNALRGPGRDTRQMIA